MQISELAFVPLSVLQRSPLPMSILRQDGTVLFHNRATEAMFERAGMGVAPIGGNIREGMPEMLSRERLGFMERLASQGRDGVVRDIFGGEQYITHLRLLPAEEGEATRKFLILFDRESGARDAEDYPGIVFHDAREQDLGRLALLSPRELEVLALVGEGLRAADIAKRLHRSLDTIHSHKQALLRKLRCKNATALALIAVAAGLKASDAERFGSN
jgi:DNA-binding CsgD family transcriptional regulator